MSKTPQQQARAAHLLFTLFTAGLWAPIWLICEILKVGGLEEPPPVQPPYRPAPPR